MSRRPQPRPQSADWSSRRETGASIREIISPDSECADNRDWIEFVQEQTDPSRGIVCVPFATGADVTDFIETTRWMYLGTFHGVPLVNGYSGYFPDSNEVLREVMQEGFFTRRALDHLQAARTQFVVVRDVLIEDRTVLQAAVVAGQLVLVFENPSTE